MQACLTNKSESEEEIKMYYEFQHSSVSGSQWLV